MGFYIFFDRIILAVFYFFDITLNLTDDKNKLTNSSYIITHSFYYIMARILSSLAFWSEKAKNTILAIFFLILILLIIDQDMY